VDEEGYDINTEHLVAEAMEPMRRRTRGKRLTEEECDAAYAEGIEVGRSEREQRIWEYEHSAEQADWDSDDAE